MGEEYDSEPVEGQPSERPRTRGPLTPTGFLARLGYGGWACLGIAAGLVLLVVIIGFLSALGIKPPPMFGAPPRLENQLKDGGFEMDDLSKYEVAGPAALWEGAAHSGKRALALSSGASVMLTAQLRRNATHEVSFWVKLVAQKGEGWGGVRVFASDRRFHELGSTPYISKTNAPLDEWVRFQFRFAARGPGRASYEIGLENLSAPEMALEALIDDLVVSE